MKLRLIILLSLVSISTFSQERKVLGRILDAETQKPIPNSNIVILGTTLATFSNLYGYFELAIDTSKHKKLIVSHIGFKTSEVPIPAADRFKFSLQKGYILLNRLNLNHYPKKLTPAPDAVGPETKNDTTLTAPESDAKFPGGIDNFYYVLGNSLASHLPEVNEKGFNMTFTINESGKPTAISTSDSTESIKNAVIQAFESMPNWTPATQRENNIPQHFVLPIVRLDPPNIEALDLGDFYGFIGRNIKYPPKARRLEIEGTVYIEFELDNSGNILAVKVLKDIGSGCGDEVKRIIAAAPPELTKSLYDKTNSKTFIIPVHFGLSKNMKSQEFKPNSDGLLLTEVVVIGYGEMTKSSDFHYYPAGETQRIPIVTDAPNIINPQNALTMSSINNRTYNDLSSALEEPKAVIRLSLVNKNLNSFPSDISKLKNLEFLDLEKNQLQTLPSDIESLIKLQELYLFDNQLQTLPSVFGNFKTLKILGLGQNQLKSFPLEITSLEALEALDLSNNQLSSIPGEIGAMKNLKFLVLQNNFIKSIPQEFYELKKLEKIFLQGNPINSNDIEILKARFKKAEIVF